MLANGPACTNAGVPSMVCIRLGMIVSFIRTVSAPLTPISSAVTGSPARLDPITMRPSRSRISPRLVASARTAMISLATAMSKPVTRVDALLFRTLADGDLAQHAVVRIDHAPPGDGIRIDIQAREAAALFRESARSDRSW